MNGNGFSEVLGCFPEHQRSIFMPQVEQFDMELLPTRFGLLGKVRIPQASGWCWAASIDDDCLITVVRIALVDDLPFHERPGTEYSSIALLSTASAQMMDAIWEHDRHAPGDQDVRVRPSSSPLLEVESEHVTVFTMVPRLYESTLAAGATHLGVCVNLLPGYFGKLERAYPGELDWLKGAFDRHVDVTESFELRSILRSITPRQANMPAARLHYEGKVLEAVSALSRYLSRPYGTAGNSRPALADHVKELLAGSLDRPPTLDELANACYTSRTSLCNEFKRACGMSIGTYLAGLRVACAKSLLESTDEPIADIARKVGYRHASTFAAMFKRACGESPLAWRSAHR